MEVPAGLGPSLQLQQLGADADWLSRSTALLPRLPALTTLYLHHGPYLAGWNALCDMSEVLAQGSLQLVELISHGDSTAGPIGVAYLQPLAQACPALRIVDKQGWSSEDLTMPAFVF